MEQAAENLNFEEAARLRDRIQAVERILEKQRIINTESQDDQDVIALASGDDETCALVFFFRTGKLVGREYFMMQGTRDSSPGEIMASFMQQFYETSPHIPGEIIVEVEPDDREVIQDWLREKRKNAAIAGRTSAISVTTPKRGDKVRLVEMVKQNANEVLEQQRIKWLTDSQKTQMALEELQEALNLAAPPRRIECYDISNTQGTNSVGAMVVFEGGRARNSEYRRFKIKQVEGANDVASHQEVLRRRFRKATGTSTITSTPDEDQMQHDWALPDLVIIDGGRAQLNAALEVMNELKLDIPTIGIAKEEGSHTKLTTGEQLFVPSSPEPIVLPRNSQGLYLLQRIRDEAHRFSITYHRSLRSKQTFKSVLDEIPGIGPKRKQALMKHFGSVRAISAASIEELASLDGMTQDAAEKVKEYIGKLE
jgi:excinuclease ABC subunit C